MDVIGLNIFILLQLGKRYTNLHPLMWDLQQKTHHGTHINSINSDCDHIQDKTLNSIVHITLHITNRYKLIRTYWQPVLLLSILDTQRV